MASSRQNYSSQVLNSSQVTTANSTTTTNAKEKSSHTKSDSKSKHGKVIHKFTSESYLRLICEKSSSTASNYDEKQFIDKSSSSSSGHIPMSGSNTIINSNNMSKRKGTSFQITSVSVSANSQQHHQQGQRNSTDNNGDDSADDLDDSHTDDNISRITDYETPSISETFSGEDVFFAQQNAFGTAPVIPTSSQYGLAIVGPDLGGNGSNLTEHVHVSVSDANIINIMGPISNKNDVDHKNERFKVVKIESTEPFKRGRWMCMDYLDHTTLQAQDDGTDGKDGEENTATKDDSIENNNETNTKLLTLNNGEADHHVLSDNEELDHEVNKINSIITIKHHYHHHQGTSHPQTMTSISMFNDHSNNVVSSQANQVAQSLPQGQIEKILIQEKLSSNLQDGLETNTQQQRDELPQSSSNNNGTSQQQSSIGSINSNIGQSNYIDQNAQHQQHAQTMTQEMIHSLMYQEQQHNQQQQQQNFHHQGATLPTNILMQNIGQNDPHIIQQSHQQINSPISSNANVLPQSIPSSQSNNVNMTENASSSSLNIGDAVEYNNNQDTMTSQFPRIGAGDNTIQSESDNLQQMGNVENEYASINHSSNNSDNNNNLTINNDGTQQQQTISSSPLSSAGIGTSTLTEGAAACVVVNDINESASNIINSNSGNNNATVGGVDDGQTMSEDNESVTLSSSENLRRKINEYRPHYLPHQHINNKQMHLAQTIKSSDINGILTMISGNDNKINPLEKKSITLSEILSAEQKKYNTRLNVEKSENRSNNTNTLFGQYSKNSTKQKTPEKSCCIGCTPGGLTTTALNMNLSTISPLCTNVGCIGTSCNSKDANSTRVSRSASPSPALGNTSDNNSASGTSAVAIDNKIEQAMDLVKSHLMFAVREEVEVLKEKIAELMDRINQLEVENTILKANASQETLSQLTTAVASPQPPTATATTQNASPVVSQIPALQQQQLQSLPQQLNNIPSSQTAMTQAVQASLNTQNQPAT